MGLFGNHKHHWVEKTNFEVGKNKEGVCELVIVVYQCYLCGSIRYDKINGNGLVSSTVTDDQGNSTK